MKICFSVVSGKKEQSSSIFSRKCWKIGEWLNMKEKESKITGSVFDSWDQENDGFLQQLGSYDNRFILIIWLEACLF